MEINKSKILIVEDEEDIRKLLAMKLGREGYEIEEASTGGEGLKKIRESAYDLLILDWMLPELSGIEIARLVRQSPKPMPILMVTARSESTDIVLGLEAGADDYVVKPFEMSIFLARVRALLRRAKDLSRPVENKDVFEYGGLTLDTLRYKVACHGSSISLTPSEFKLLTALMQNRGKVLTRERLIDSVQGSDVSVTERTVDTHVFGLRKKMGECGPMIETIRGVGYRLVESELQEVK